MTKMVIKHGLGTRYVMNYNTKETLHFASLRVAWKLELSIKQER